MLRVCRASITAHRAQRRTLPFNRPSLHCVRRPDIHYNACTVPRSLQFLVLPPALYARERAAALFWCLRSYARSVCLFRTLSVTTGRRATAAPFGNAQHVATFPRQNAAFCCGWRRSPTCAGQLPVVRYARAAADRDVPFAAANTFSPPLQTDDYAYCLTFVPTIACRATRCGWRCCCHLRPLVRSLLSSDAVSC